MSERPITLTIAALGGQGGGVLAEWLIEIAEAQGYLAQSTSVPGVAQRTGATIYYLEFFPRAAAERAGREPVMALMPVSGNVDCVVASELAEAARVIQRGLVTPDRTTLIASSHRSYTIGEKSAMGDGAVDQGELLKLVRSQPKRLVLFDMDELATRHESIISSVMLGAICGSGALPFQQSAFEAAIEHGGIAVQTNLKAFEAARAIAERGDTQAQSAAEITGMAPSDGVPLKAKTPALQPLLDRVHKLPEAVRAVVFEGVRRTLDYQDGAYAALYLERVERIAAMESGVSAAASSEVRAAHSASATNSRTTTGVAPAGNPGAPLTEATARGLALWMTFEDTIRVADLKTRAGRFNRVRDEVRASPNQLVAITEFMKPRVEEIAGTLPASLGRKVLASPGLRKSLSHWTQGKQIHTTTLAGFLLLYTLAGLKRWRRGTLRFHEEDARIADWLTRITSLAPNNYALATELARAQRLIKGYGETHERGWQNFRALTDRLDTLAKQSDGAARLARLQEAALADEDGRTLGRELAAIV